MNWDAIGAVGQIVGSFAVIVTLVYLAMQVRHFKQQVLINSYQHTISSLKEFADQISSSGSLAETVNPVTLRPGGWTRDWWCSSGRHVGPSAETSA